jgi:ABC-type Mn2+/Zn2+ transport system permease subunit
MDLLQYGFFQHALLGSLLTAIACGMCVKILLLPGYGR